MTMRVLESSDLPLLRALSAEAPALLGHAADLSTWPATPSGRDVHAWVSERGALRVCPVVRTRARHSAAIELVAADDGPRLLAHAVDFCDRWTTLDRLELALPAGHPALSAALALGFVLEVTRAGRSPDGRDGLLLGRLRPGFAPRPLPPPPEWPARHRRPLPAWTWRPLRQDDSEVIRQLSVHPSALFGTLQTPSSSVDFYTQRFNTPRAGDVMGLMVAGDEVLGIGGLHPTEHPDVRVLGMAVSADWQGCGVGRALLTHLLSLARREGARRVELSVYTDNHRAQALYAACGFRPDGVRRCDAVRDGGHTHSLDMSHVFSAHDEGLAA